MPMSPSITRHSVLCLQADGGEGRQVGTRPCNGCCSAVVSLLGSGTMVGLWVDAGLAVWVSLCGIVYLGFFVQFALANNATFCTLNYMVLTCLIPNERNGKNGKN
jgi:hypothetical protein